MEKIDYNNKNEINNLRVHDSEFNGLCYNYKKRQISFSCKNSFFNEDFEFIFNNVIFCSMQSCSFWHGGNNILNIYLEENSAHMKQLIEIQNSDMDLYDGSYLSKGIIYLPIEMEINSGDKLLIICESINYSIKK
jgi:hypothetical protein